MLLVLLTVTWGLNWPVMKVGVTGFPPLTFRSLSMWLGLPVLWAVTAVLKVPLRIERKDWREVGLLTVTNMLVWHVLAILAVQALSSGRAAILGYTMPIWSALWGLQLYGQRLRPRQLGRHRRGRPSACCCCSGTSSPISPAVRSRPSACCSPLPCGRSAPSSCGTRASPRRRSAIVFWMTVITTLAMSLFAVVFEHALWIAPSPTTWAAIGYNAVLIFGFAQAIWLVLARNLPPVASTMSVMLIPVLGTLTGALVARRKAALAGRRRDRADAGRDRRGHVAGRAPRAQRA